MSVDTYATYQHQTGLDDGMIWVISYTFTHTHIHSLSLSLPPSLPLSLSLLSDDPALAVPGSEKQHMLQLIQANRRIKAVIRSSSNAVDISICVITNF